MPDLAKLIAEQGSDLRLRQAIITAVPAGGLCTIRFGDLASTSPADNIVGVRCLASAPLANGDTVWVLQQRGALLALGKIGVPIVSVADFFYTDTVNNGGATSYAEFATHNSVGSLPYDYTMIVKAYVNAGGNGAASELEMDVRDGAGTSIQFKGVQLAFSWDQKLAVNDRQAFVAIGKKDYAAEAACGFRLAYKVNASNVFVDVGTHVQLVRR